MKKTSWLLVCFLIGCSRDPELPSGSQQSSSSTQNPGTLIAGEKAKPAEDTKAAPEDAIAAVPAAPTSGATTQEEVQGVENAQTFAEPATAKTPAPSVEKIVELGRRAFERGRYAEAQEFYLQATELRADDPRMWAGLGATLMKLKNYKFSAGAYEQALQLEPNNVNYWTALGQARKLEGDSEAAKEALAQAKKLTSASEGGRKEKKAKAKAAAEDSTALKPSAASAAPESAILGDVGLLKVLVVPWGDVWIDGVQDAHRGQSPIPLKPGKHTVKVGRLGTIEQTKSVVIKKGQTTHVTFELGNM